MSLDLVEISPAIERLAAEFAEHLAPVLRPSGAACPVEHYAAWAKLVAVGDRTGAALATVKALRQEVRRALHERAGAGPLDPASHAAALFSVLALKMCDVLPPAYLAGCDGGDLYLGAAAALNRLAHGAIESAPARAGLVWLLTGALAFRADIEAHLAPPVREYLAAVDAIAAGRPLPTFTGAPNAFTRFLAEVKALHYAPAPVPAPRPLLGRVRRFLGGDRFRLSRTGQLRLALAAIIALTAAIAGGVYSGARSTVAEFRAENKLPTFERSLVPLSR